MDQRDISKLKPGDHHYKAFIGPPEEYDLVAAMVFNLLTTLGLREDHKVLDVGCGSLRNGRLLIPYLARGNYWGIEPYEWLVRDAISNEIGQDQIDLKQPNFYFTDSLDVLEEKIHFDFGFAQSIFSHASHKLIRKWLKGVKNHMASDGLFLATYLRHAEDYRGLRGDWIYPDCVYYKDETMREMAAEFNLKFRPIAWVHPRQIWGAFYFEEFDDTFLDARSLNWNTYIQNNFDVRFPVESDNVNQEDLLQLNQQLEAHRLQLETIYNSRGWKFLEKIKGMYFPLIKKIKGEE